jgi:hypothetical protein
MAISQIVTNSIATGAVTDALLPAGSVLQVVSTNFTTYYTNATATGSYVDVSGFSASITPSSASNKVLVIVSVSGLCVNDNSTTTQYCKLQIADSSNNQIFQILNQSIPGGSGPNVWVNYSTQYLHSPASTSSLTYKLRYSMSSNGIQINNYIATSGNMSNITLMEIAA